jgi:HEAT repeat protein
MTTMRPASGRTHRGADRGNEAILRTRNTQHRGHLRPARWKLLDGLQIVVLTLLGVAALTALTFFGYLYLAAFLLLLTLFIPALPEYRARGYSPLGYVLLALWAQIILTGYAAPFLALAYALRDYFHFEEPRLPLIGAYGPGLMAWVRLVAGVTGIAMSVGFVIFALKWRLEQLRQIGNLPRSKARSAAIGLAEFEGVARHVAGPGGEEHDERKRILPADDPLKPVARFYLEDETGRILVDPAGARLRTGMAFHVSVQLCEITLHNASKPRGRKGELWDGDPVYLIGNVQIDPEAVPDPTGAAGILVRPLAQPHHSGPLWRLLFGRQSPGEQLNAPNVFFASDSRERGARQAILSGMRQSVLFALIWIAASGWLLSREIDRIGERDHWSVQATAPQPPDPRAERARLVAELHSGDPLKRSAALGRLWERRHEFEKNPECCPELAPHLLAALENKQRHERDFAVYALARMRHDRKRAVTAIVPLLQSPDEGVRESAAHALRQIKTEPQAAVPALVAALGDPVPGVAHAVCHALAEYPEAMALAFQCLKERLADADREVRHEAVSRLSRTPLDPVFALPLWGELLNGPDTQFTYFAAIGLLHLEREAKPALPQLIEALRNKRHNGRVFVVRTLGKIGPDAAPAVPDLVAALAEHRTEVQSDAVEALGAIGPPAAQAIPALRQLEHEAYDADVRSRAARALRRIERPPA